MAQSSSAYTYTYIHVSNKKLLSRRQIVVVAKIDWLLLWRFQHAALFVCFVVASTHSCRLTHTHTHTQLQYYLFYCCLKIPIKQSQEIIRNIYVHIYVCMCVCTQLFMSIQLCLQINLLYNLGCKAIINVISSKNPAHTHTHTYINTFVCFVNQLIPHSV